MYHVLLVKLFIVAITGPDTGLIVAKVPFGYLSL